MYLRVKNLFSMLGPGLMYAGAAVGVSHLVQSTRAGASFGYQLVWAVLLVNLFKYPFFELGPRYAAATGEDLLVGYRRIGKWALILFTLISVASMFITIAAISLVTTGIIQSVFGLSLNIDVGCTILLLVCFGILAFGRYALLDRFTKYVVILLSLTTIAAIGLLLGKVDLSGASASAGQAFSFSENKDLFFLLAFMGWMPAPIEISVWHSLWTVESQKNKIKKRTLDEILFDFKTGYWGTLLLAFAFLSLGAMLMYGKEEVFSFEAVSFSGQLISLYTQSIGDWAYPLVGFAAIATMISTTLTCLDGYPRVAARAMSLLRQSDPQAQQSENSYRLYLFWMLVVVIGVVVILFQFVENMHRLVDVTTCLSFVSAPVLATLNLICGHKFLKTVESRQPLKVIILGYAGVGFLSLFSVFYLWKILT